MRKKFKSDLAPIDLAVAFCLIAVVLYWVGVL